MLVDEFYFHQKRGLPTWERWGHPLDSLSVLAPFIYLLLSEQTQPHALVYLGLSLGSCVFITKDEWVHAKECSASENWLHALLFLLHPMVFFCAGLLWWQGEWIPLRMQSLVIAAFMIYQILRWNISWQKTK